MKKESIMELTQKEIGRLEGELTGHVMCAITEDDRCVTMQGPLGTIMEMVLSIIQEQLDGVPAELAPQVISCYRRKILAMKTPAMKASPKKGDDEE